MIKLKFSFGEENSKDREFDIVEGELLSAAMARSIDGVPLEGRESHEIFQVVVNGHLIEKDFWEFTQLKSGDAVVISPNIKSGDSGQIFKQIAIIAITVAASYFLGPAGYGLTGAALGAATAAVSIGVSLIFNALIPPPVPSQADFGALQGYESSQMYSISGQSNTIRRLATVPKVYGTHRIFPNVAAVPYTELDTDPVTGELVQYLYVIYDFGLGPLQVKTIYIGDTPFSADRFTDFKYNFVDLNKPAVSEGIWDDQLNDAFTIYKGDIEGDTLGIGLDGNKDAGDPQSTYEAIRNSAENTDGSNQEIVLNFTNPIGLYGFSSTGVKDYRKIELQIDFALVGSSTWRSYNDLTYVSSFVSKGGDSDNFELDVALIPPVLLGGSVSAAYGDGNPYYETLWGQAQTSIGKVDLAVRIKANAQSIVVTAHAGLEVGSPVYLNVTEFLGIVQAIAPYSDPTYSVVTLDRLINSRTSVGEVRQHKVFHGFDPVTYSYTVWRDLRPTARFTTSTVGRARIKRAETGPVHASFRFSPKVPGQYQVRVRRLNTTSPYTTNVADDLIWGSLTTRFDRATIVTDKRHVFMELRIKATGQINGTVSNLSAVCTSICDVWDGTTWTMQETNNPAWIFADLLTGEVNKKAVDVSRLHLESLLEWAEFCDEIPDPPPTQTYLEKRFETNFILDYPAALQTVLNQVANGAQASLNIIDGKYGVLIDRFRSTPVQIFTPRNSRDFSSVRVYGPRPHAVRVKYIDPQLAWEVSEVVVYDDGQDITTATEIEDLTSFACTNQEQAWRFGRYMIAQNKLRQETISILVDFEHLVCTRGDYVQITQDVMRVGGTPARVKAIDGTTITIDDSLDIDELLSYGYVYRSATGDINTSTLTPLTPSTFELDGDLPAVGDLIVIGEVGSTVYDCLVKAITPNDDMSASITLVEKADGIYDYESTGVLPDYDPQLSTTSRPDFFPPREVADLEVTDSGWDCAAGENGYEYFVELSWGVPPGSIYELFEVYGDDGRGFTLAGVTRSSIYRFIVNEDRLDIEHTFKVLAVSATGKKLALGEVTGVTSTPTEKTTPPSDVESLSVNITNEVVQFTWPRIEDCDCAQYLIRYSPSVSGATWETSTPLLRADKSSSSASAQARTGTYLIKAVDFLGLESENAAQAVTTIPNLFNLNVIEVITDSPDFPGASDRTEIYGDAVSLVLDTAVSGAIPVAQFYAEGYYYFENLLDLGEIYTVRLQSLIQAEGYTEEDIMANWETLADVLAMSNSKYSEWDVEAQYRSTDTLNVMADWTTLAGITYLNEGSSEIWTDWRTFIMGDATGRVFQFRLKLISNKLSVSPRVFDATIRADMPDRIDTFENELVTNVGRTFTYTPAFNGPAPSPNVQISIDDAESGDYWVFADKTLEGFTITIYDKNDVAVERTIDIAAKGYGRKAASTI